MDIEINAAEGTERSEALDEHIRSKLGRVERQFGDRLTRLEVFLKDVNAGKGGSTNPAKWRRTRLVSRPWAWRRAIPTCTRPLGMPPANWRRPSSIASGAKRSAISAHPEVVSTAIPQPSAPARAGAGGRARLPAPRKLPKVA